MKFITKTDVVLKDEECGIELVMRPATNAARFTIYDLGSDDSLASRVRTAEYVFKNCITSLTVNGEPIEPAAMVDADLSDTDTAQVYFTCANLVVSAVLGIDDDKEEEAKK